MEAAQVHACITLAQLISIIVDHNRSTPEGADRMIFRSSEDYKNTGMTPIGIDPQGPSQSNFLSFAQKFDARSSFVSMDDSDNMLYL